MRAYRKLGCWFLTKEQKVNGSKRSWEVRKKEVCSKMSGYAQCSRHKTCACVISMGKARWDEVWRSILFETCHGLNKSHPSRLVCWGPRTHWAVLFGGLWELQWVGSLGHRLLEDCVFLILMFLLFMCMCVCLCVCVCECSACRGQKRASDPPGWSYRQCCPVQHQWQKLHLEPLED